jgi:hypothetical protein
MGVSSCGSGWNVGIVLETAFMPQEEITAPASVFSPGACVPEIPIMKTLSNHEDAHAGTIGHSGRHTETFHALDAPHAHTDAC